MKNNATWQKSLSYLRTYWLAIAILAAWVIIYLPYLMHGTFYVDDWGFVRDSHAMHNNPFSIISYNFRSMGFRPVSAVVVPAVAAVFRSNFLLISILNLMLYLAAVLVVTRALSKLLGKDIKPWRYPGALSLFFLPVISTTFIFGPLTHLVTTLAVLFWAGSFYYTVRSSKGKSRKDYLLAGLLITLGLLCYEILLPLLVFNVAAYLYGIRSKDKLSTRSLLKHLMAIIGTIMAALLVATIYQKVIAVSILHLDNNSRTHFAGLDYSIRRYLLDWYKLWYVMRYDFIEIARQSAHVAVHSSWIIINSLVLTILSVLSSYRLAIILRTKKPLPAKELWWWLAAALVAIMGGVALITLSAYPLSIAGYLNRLLFPLWFSFSLVLFILCYYVRPKYLLPIIATVCFSSAVIFQAELKMFVQGSEVRTAIKQDLGHKLANLDHGNYSLIAYVPRCVPGTILNDDIFSEQWDIGKIAEYQSGFKVQRASAIQAWNFTTPGMLEVTNDKLVLFGWFTITPRNMPVLFYSYNQNSHKSSLSKITKYSDLQALINSLRPKVQDNCKVMAGYGTRVDYIDSRLRQVFSAGPAM